MALGACSSARISTPDLRLPTAYEGAAAENAALPAASLDRWWTLYGDAQLTSLVEEALVRAPNARQALQRIEEARATRSETLAGYLPQGALSGQAQYQHTDQTVGGVGVAASGVTTGTTTGGTGSGATGSTGSTGVASSFLTPGGDLTTYAASFQVSYEVDIFGRRAAAARAADADVAAQRFDYEATRSTLARDVATGLFQARGFVIQLEDARETARITGSLANTARISAERGLTSTGDQARLDTDAETARAEVARLEGAAKAGRRSLLALVGRGGDGADSLPIAAVTADPPAPPAVTPGELLARRPDVREAEARLRSASYNLKLDRLALFPKFSLAPGGQISKSTGSYDATTTVFSMGLNAVLPVLDRPRLLAVIRGGRARGDEAVAAYEGAVQNGYRDAENGLSTLAADRGRVAALRVAEQRARFAFDSKDKGYKLGLIDLTTLLDAERSWRTARATLTSAQITTLVNSATLFQALGGGWPSDGATR